MNISATNSVNFTGLWTLNQDSKVCTYHTFRDEYISPNIIKSLQRQTPEGYKFSIGESLDISYDTYDKAQNIISEASNGNPHYTTRELNEVV